MHTRSFGVGRWTGEGRWGGSGVGQRGWRMRRKALRVAFVRGVPWPRVGRRHAWKLGVLVASEMLCRHRNAAGKLGEVQGSICSKHTGLEVVVCLLQWLLAA